MIHAAAKAGVDYVKFQTFHAESLVSANAPKAEYQLNNCKEGGDTQLEMLRQLELSHSDFSILRDECRQEGIGFMSTPFDIESADFLA
ncbi:MAG: N-acetylneuraminate synthase family protein, partial [Duncaniella sp.]|nr:N-acetylneuraminate synthase family protein [Duncaniella sp.]